MIQPTSLPEYLELRKKFRQAQSRDIADRFSPRASDVIISSFPKCGSTWLQQIVHTLRSRGHQDFDDISSLIPWIELAEPLGLDLNADQPFEPRAFKSHLPQDLAPST